MDHFLMEWELSPMIKRRILLLRLTMYNPMMQVGYDKYIITYKDILVICAFTVTGFEIVQQIKDRNYSPRGIFVTPFLVWKFQRKVLICTRSNGNHLNILNTSMVMIRYSFVTTFLTRIIKWVELAGFAADGWFGTSHDFGNDFRNLFGYNPDGFNAFGSIAPFVLQQAIIQSKSLAQSDVKFALSRFGEDFW